MTAAQTELARRANSAIAGATPGVLLRAYRGGERLCEIDVGVTHDFYDLASVTKVVFTQQAMMQSFEQGLWHAQSRVGDQLPGFAHADIRIVDLLTHTSGMAWWKPFHESIALDMGMAEKRRWLLGELAQSEVQPTGHAVYSDLGIMLLGFFLERLHGADLLTVWAALRARCYANTALTFHPQNVPLQARGRYAPTENCPWRGKVLQGEVHDDNTWAFGGVSTHAGLFGSLDDLAAYGLMLRGQVLGQPGSVVGHATAQWFARRAIAPTCGDWALGFMLPSSHGASCGSYLSADSIGHTGFTGTSIWFDLQHDLLVLILSNRVALGRDNRAFVDLRPRLHDWVCELFCPDMPKVRP